MFSYIMTFIPSYVMIQQPPTEVEAITDTTHRQAAGMCLWGWIFVLYRQRIRTVSSEDRQTWTVTNKKHCEAKEDAGSQS
jgi:hypothetical protein